eukprot:2579736-Pleurochrysis_carterae.AAC.1
MTASTTCVSAQGLHSRRDRFSLWCVRTAPHDACVCAPSAPRALEPCTTSYTRAGVCVDMSLRTRAQAASRAGGGSGQEGWGGSRDHKNETVNGVCVGI